VSKILTLNKMGMYFENTTDEEDIQYIQQLLDNHEAQIHNGKIYQNENVLWEVCDQGKLTPWGIGVFTQHGVAYICGQLITEGRYSSSLGP
jgi:hypothetical protein